MSPGNQPSAIKGPRRLRFGTFELDLATSQLTRDGRPVHIQDQPLRLIALLAQRGGEIVSREETRHCVWPDDTFVDVDSGLKTVIKKARQALEDDADNPRFIQTVPRKGYRFLAPVSWVMPAPDTTAGEPLALKLVPPPAPAAEKAPVIPEKPAPAESAQKPHVPRSGWLLAGILVLAAAGIIFFTRDRPPVLDHLRPFATARGVHLHPAFSPDGEILAFDWQGPQDHHTNVYVERLNSSAPVRLTSDSAEASCPAWSPDGSVIAFLRNSRPETFSIVTIPLLGPGEQVRGEIKTGATPWLAWSPDGKWFAAAERMVPGRNPSVILISASTGEKRVITAPPAGWRGDSLPVFAPDSASVAFRRTKPASGAEDIYSVPISGGEPKRITFDDRAVEAFAVTPDRGLLLSSKREGSMRGLWWMPARGGRMTRLIPSLVDAGWPAISRDGKHVAFSKIIFSVNLWRVNADGTDSAVSLIDSEQPNTSPQFSPDGRRIAFHSVRSGANEVWVCDSDGSNAVRLTDGGGVALGNPRWSPDGRQIAYEWQPSGKGEIYLISSDGGKPRLLVSDPHYQYSIPAWSHDGRWVYFTSDRSGQFEIWKIPVAGGNPVEITHNGGFSEAESPDGRYLYYLRPKAREIWRFPLENGQVSGDEVKVVGPLGDGEWGNWVPANEGIYYIQRGKDWQDGTIIYQDNKTGSAKTVYTMRKPPVYGNGGLALSPDQKSLLFAQVDADESSLFVQ